MLILQFCQCKHSFAIWNAFSHLTPLLLHTYAIVARLEAHIVCIDWHGHVQITSGIVLKLLAIDKIFWALRLTKLNANFMHFVHVVRLCLIHEGLLIRIQFFAFCSTQDLLWNNISGLLVRDYRINFWIHWSHRNIPTGRLLARYEILRARAIRAWW